ncbi:nitroreductase family protein [Caulobacter sp. KR2-114]|uniref:nitroreductase family protein n=1 Tax=Caulobacter sp. KR2-114 TaxID=3400912 RepID=UPI003BFDA6A2
MDAIDAIYRRRAIRDYAPDPPARGELERLVEIAVQAPSGMNRQPWAFAIVLGRERLAQASALAKAALAPSAADLGPELAAMLASPEFDIFYNAPALIVVCATEAGPMAVTDACLAAATLMIAAADSGLGTCWIGFAEAWLASEAGRSWLAIPDDWRVVAPIIVGRPRGAPERPARKAPTLVWVGEG